MKSLLPGARDSTYYVFTEDGSRDNNKFHQRLSEVTIKYNAGGPMNLILTDRSYNWVGVDVWPRRNDNRIVSSREISPDRIWFYACVAYMGRDDLLVSVHATAAEDSQVSIQKLDAGTGDVVWSTPVQADDSYLFEHFDKSIRVGDRYIISGDDYTIIDADGKIIKEIKLYRFTK